VVRQFRRNFALLTAGEVEAAEELVARNNVTEDRRRGMREVTIGRAARLVAGRALHETLGGATFGIGAVLDQRGEHLALVRLDTVGALGPTVQSHAVIECDADGLLTALVVFDPEAFDEARVELDRRVPANRAETFGKVFTERWVAEGADAVAELIADDVVFEDHRAGLRASWRGRAALLDNLRVIDELTTADARVVTTDPIAHRGDRLSLHTYDFPLMGVETLNVSEFDEDGRLVFTTFFEPDDLAGATQALDRRYAEAEGAAFAEEITLSSAFGQAVAAGDADALVPLLAEDFVCADHRAIGWGERGRDTFLAAVGARPDTLGSGVGISAELQLRPGLILAPYEIWTRSATGSDLQEVGVSITQVRDGQVVRLELYGEGDRAAADERFVELAAPGSGLGIASAATRRLAPYADRFARRDWAWLGVLWAERVRNDDRRSGANSGVSIGRERMLALTESLAESGFTSMHQVPVAVRGDELALYLRTWGHLDGFELAVLALMEVDAAGHLVANTMWEPDDLEAAVDELDRRFAEGEGAAHADDLALCVACGRALAAGDAGSLDALLADDFVLVDHLPLRDGFGEISRAEFLLVVADRPAVMGTGAGFYRAHHRIETGLVLSDYELQSRSDRGFEATELGLALFVIRHGRIARIESFPVEDREAAEARFDELSAAAETAENFAAQRTREQIRRWMVDGPESMRELVDDYRLVDHRLGMGSAIEGVDAFVANLSTIDRLRGEQEFEVFRVLAQRGQFLALVDQGFEGDLELHACTVVEVDPTGRAVRGDVFDREDLAAALAELDRRYAAGEGSAYAGEILLASAFSQAVATGDSGALAPLLADDYVSIDHRLIGFGELDRETTLDAVAARADTLGSGAVVSSEVRVGPGLVLAAYEVRTRSSAGSDLEDAAVSILQVSDGQVLHLELFDEGDWAAAEARFEELGRGAKENLAARRNREVIRRWMTDGPEAVRGLVTEDYHLADHRPGLTAEHAGVDALVDHLGAIDEVRGEQEFEVFRVVAQRGRRLALLDQGFDGDLVAHTFVVSEVDDDGLGVRVDGYEPEDLADALAELDRRYLAGEGAEFPAVMTVMSEWTQLMARREWDATAALVSPGFRAVDHRPMGHGELSFEDRLARDVALGESAPGAITFIFDVLERSDRVGLLRGGWIDPTPDGAGFESAALVVLALDAEGRFDRLEVFGEDDLVGARARFDALRRPS